MGARRVLRYVLRETGPLRRGLSWWNLTEIAIVAAGFLAYFLVRGSVVDRAADALANARAIVEFQAALGLWFEPRIQAASLQAHAFVRAMNFVYFWLDFPLIVGLGLVLFWWRRAHYTVLRDALLISGVIALVFYYSYPVAPPRYLVEWGFIDTLAHFDNLSYQAQSMRSFVNPYAAVPSLHVGWAALVAATLFRATRQVLVRLAGVALVVVQAMAVVVTGNHFFFDAFIGFGVCAAAWVMAVRLQESGYRSIRVWLVKRERPPARLGG
ncbi:MAG: inositol phosphorylceramide synthase [Dehalococcoidia bacterium]|nr:inositol phosphorylceramide synthase [Dehalococcoidia bacterium]